MSVRAVIFDLGGTLLAYGQPGEAMTALAQQGLRRVYHLLRHDGQPLPSPETFQRIIEDHYQRIARRGGPGNTDDMLRAGLTAMGITPDPGLWQMCIRAMYAPLHEIVRPIPAARETLVTLHREGCRLGLLSNTFWPGYVHDEQLGRFGLMDLLPVRIYSSETPWHKPDPRI